LKRVGGREKSVFAKRQKALGRWAKPRKVSFERSLLLSVFGELVGNKIVLGERRRTMDISEGAKQVNVPRRRRKREKWLETFRLRKKVARKTWLSKVTGAEPNGEWREGKQKERKGTRPARTH